MRAAATLALAMLLTASVAAQVPSLTDQRVRLALAKHEAGAAAARADRLATDAATERDAAERARTEERALGARVEAAQAQLAAARARAAIVDQLLVEQRARLASAQLPVARLLAALQSLARRPTVAAIAQPGSVDDLVHVRAVLGSALPVVHRQTEGVRVELAATRRLQANAVLAAQALRDGRIVLERERMALARAEAEHRGRAQALGRGAIGESDRALALGERARDLVDSMAEQGAAQATGAGLAAIDGPVARPLPPGTVAPLRVRGAYRSPVVGRLVTGFGEISDAGVRARGLTWVVASDAVVVAPASGVVRYARRFRQYGTILIVDHGDGWTTLLTGLASVRVGVGMRVLAGAPVGVASRGDDPRITVELRRRGQPVDVAALIG